jgi:hypothetical protein
LQLEQGVACVRACEAWGFHDQMGDSVCTIGPGDTVEGKDRQREGGTNQGLLSKDE